MLTLRIDSVCVFVFESIRALLVIAVEMFACVCFGGRLPVCVSELSGACGACGEGVSAWFPL